MTPLRPHEAPRADPPSRVSTRAPRILIVRLSSLGDIVHTFPALMTLRRSLPDAHLTWVVEDRFASVLDGVAEIDEVRVLQRSQGPRARFRAIRDIGSARYDLAIDYQGLMKSALVARLAGIRKRVGFARPGCREGAWLTYTHRVSLTETERNIVDRNIALSREALRILERPEQSVQSVQPVQPEQSEQPVRSAPSGASEQPGSLYPMLPNDAAARVDAILSRHGLRSGQFVIFNPGARWPTKWWPTASFVELGNRLRDEFSFDIVVTAFGDERSLGEAIAEGLRERAPLLDDLSFLEHARLCRHAAVVVGSDTGPMHLAHWANAPTVVLFGPTDAWRNAPPGGSGTALQSALHCPPCWKRSCPKHDSNRCMEQIDVTTVLETIRSIVATSRQT